jgi:hypothetical protein
LLPILAARAPDAPEHFNGKMEDPMPVAGWDFSKTSVASTSWTSGPTGSAAG